MKSSLDLSGKVAVVTGGGGILGRGFCTALAAHGARVAVVDISQASVQETVQAVERELPGSVARGYDVDITNPVAVRGMTERIVADFGAIHVLHNNAASKSSNVRAFFTPFEDYPLEIWREVMSVNLDGAFLVAQSVGAQMVRQGTGGSIVQTASIYGVVGPDQRIYEGSDYLGGPINTPAVYSASKGAIIALTRHLATYWAKAGIRVNTLTPGGVESGQNSVFRDKYAGRVPMGRMGRADEMQAALVFLASDASSYITGQNLVVDGGLTCW